MPKTLSQTCYALYEQGGQSAVFDYINAEHPEIKWGWCEPCEIKSPADPADQTCLVCGSPTSKPEDDTAEWL